MKNLNSIFAAYMIGWGWAFAVRFVIGLAMIGLWMLWGHHLRLCAGLQSVMLVSMNTLEILLARDLLLSPWPMVTANVVLLSCSWYVALN